MKKIYCLIPLILLLLFALSCNAQFKLSGKIVNYTGKETLQINVPVVFGFHKENSTEIPVEKDGSFNISIPIHEKKFGNLIFKRKFNTLLLSPSKSLQVTLNSIDSSATLVSGSALPENKVVQEANIEEYPFFLSTSKYDTLLLSGLKALVLAPYFAQRDEKTKRINRSSIANTDRLLIASEVRYIAYNYLNEFARLQVSNRAVVDSLILEVFDQAPVVPLVLPAGPQFYAFIDNYIRFLETKAFAKIKKDKIPTDQPIPYFGISLDSANVFVNKYSKAQWRFLGAIQNLSPVVVEKYAYQQIVTAYQYKDFKQFKDLSAAFKTKFSSSPLLNSIERKDDELQQILVKNETNPQIKIVDGYEKINSINEVVKQFPGKVVYLDIWGTWCGPCKEELKHTPALKNKFKNRNVVFLYLDMDEDDKDQAWRDFIKVNELTGVHLRKNKLTIDPLWEELLTNAEDKARFYPQYFIFDQTGKLVITKAKRPSDKEILYAQIENVLTGAK